MSDEALVCPFSFVGRVFGVCFSPNRRPPRCHPLDGWSFLESRRQRRRCPQFWPHQWHHSMWQCGRDPISGGVHRGVRFECVRDCRARGRVCGAQFGQQRDHRWPDRGRAHHLVQLRCPPECRNLRDPNQRQQWRRHRLGSVRVQQPHDRDKHQCAYGGGAQRRPFGFDVFDVWR